MFISIALIDTAFSSFLFELTNLTLSKKKITFEKLRLTFNFNPKKNINLKLEICFIPKIVVQKHIYPNRFESLAPVQRRP